MFFDGGTAFGWGVQWPEGAIPSAAGRVKETDPPSLEGKGRPEIITLGVIRCSVAVVDLHDGKNP